MAPRQQLHSPWLSSGIQIYEGMLCELVVSAQRDRKHIFAPDTVTIITAVALLDNPENNSSYREGIDRTKARARPTHDPWHYGRPQGWAAVRFFASRRWFRSLSDILTFHLYGNGKQNLFPSSSETDGEIPVPTIQSPVLGYELNRQRDVCINGWNKEFQMQCIAVMCV